MSRNASARVEFGDGEHDFRLGLGEIDELEEKTGYGLKALYYRIHNGDYKTSEIREVLRLGLMGAGMKPVEARNLVNRYAVPGWIIDCEAPVKLVMLAALVGNGDDPPGETTGRATTEASAASPTDDSISL